MKNEAGETFWHLMGTPRFHMMGQNCTIHPYHLHRPICVALHCVPHWSVFRVLVKVFSFNPCGHKRMSCSQVVLKSGKEDWGKNVEQLEWLKILYTYTLYGAHCHLVYNNVRDRGVSDIMICPGHSRACECTAPFNAGEYKTELT
jgi:hypothetical protein